MSQRGVLRVVREESRGSRETGLRIRGAQIGLEKGVWEGGGKMPYVGVTLGESRERWTLGFKG